MIKEVFYVKSTNGRWGMSLVSDEDVKFPAQGKLEHLGSVQRISTYRFTPSSEGFYVLPVIGDVKVLGGAQLVEEMDLQSGKSVSLVLMSATAIIEVFGYRGRSSSIQYYANGELKDIPPSVLLAMGLIEDKGDKTPIEPPEPMPTAMGEALRMAGL
jgi:hypothetical protein